MEVAGLLGSVERPGEERGVRMGGVCESWLFLGRVELRVTSYFEDSMG